MCNICLTEYIIIMETQDAWKFDKAALEERRKQAARLYQNGKCSNCIEIGKIVGTYLNTMGKWISRWKKSGLPALKVKKCGHSVGLERHLLPHEEIKIQKDLVEHWPDQLRLPSALWTRQTVRSHIKISFGVEIPVRTIGEYLKR